MEEKIINNESIEEVVKEVEPKETIVENGTTILNNGTLQKGAAVLAGVVIAYGAYKVTKPVAKKCASLVKNGISGVKNKLKKDDNIVDVEVHERDIDEQTPNEG